MSTLGERVAAFLADIDSEIQHAQKVAEEQVKKLEARRMALIQAQKLISPEIESAVAGLTKIGIINL